MMEMFIIMLCVSKKLYKSYIAKIDKKEITEDHLDALKYGVVIDGPKNITC